MSPEQVHRQALAYERGLQTQKQIQLTYANGRPSKSRFPTSGAQPVTDEKPTIEPSVQAVSNSRPNRGQPRGAENRRTPPNRPRQPPALPRTTAGSSRAPSHGYSVSLNLVTHDNQRRRGHLTDQES